MNDFIQRIGPVERDIDPIYRVERASDDADGKQQPPQQKRRPAPEKQKQTQTQEDVGPVEADDGHLGSGHPRTVPAARLPTTPSTGPRFGVHRSGSWSCQTLVAGSQPGPIQRRDDAYTRHQLAHRHPIAREQGDKFPQAGCLGTGSGGSWLSYTAAIGDVRDAVRGLSACSATQSTMRVSAQ